MLNHLLIFAIAAPVRGPPAPPPPAIYDVQIRYQINAYGNEHIAQYLNMARYFKEAGFVRDPDEVVPGDEAEDQRYDRMTGRIPSDKVPLLLDEPHVRVLQLLPKGVKPPADAAASSASICNWLPASSRINSACCIGKYAKPSSI